MISIKQLLKKVVPSRILENRRKNFLIRKVLLDPDGFIVSSGFWNSVQHNLPVDQTDTPLPWTCYPMINFLKERLTRDMLLFEYGSGFSTAFFSNYVRKVFSVEYDEDWYKKVLSLNKNADNVDVIYNNLHEDYAASIARVNAGDFDVIYVDGRNRVQCCENAISFLKDDGIVILDDSEREKYCSAFTFFAQKGYAAITFMGLKPGNGMASQATVFYKRGHNCFEI